MADIFISYKSERRPAARHLKKVLECYFQAGVEDCVWYDYGLVPGRDFEPRIMAEIAKAKVVIVLWCERSVKSSWVRREAAEAKRMDKFLPCWIESCQLPPEFAGAQTINLSGWDASPRSPMLDLLLEEIGGRIGREAVLRLSRLRELHEDWRDYGSPSLADFATLAKPVEPGAASTPAPLPATPVLGPPPPGLSPNMAQHWENAVGGDVASLYEIGRAFGNASGGIARNDTEAIRIIQLARDRGSIGALASLGAAFVEGRGGLAKDDVEAVRLFKLAADQGNALGQANLGFMYDSGLGGLAKDEQEAVRLYKLAADQGNSIGQVNLGAMYEQGSGGLAKDEHEAVRLYKLAVDQGDAMGQVNLGAMYERGSGGLAKDEQKAVRLYQLAARGGNEWAQDQLRRRGETW